MCQELVSSIVYKNHMWEKPHFGNEEMRLREGVVGKIKAPKDVHIQIPELLNASPCMVKGTLQVGLRLRP